MIQRLARFRHFHTSSDYTSDRDILAFPAARTTSAEQFSRPNYKEIQGVTYKIAEDRSEREAAYRLVYEAYNDRGLIDANPYQMRVTPYQLLPTTDTFLAIHNDQVIYTMSLISDDELGLPLEELYGGEVEQMRQEGFYLSEVSSLASRQGYFDRTEMFEVFSNLSSLVINYCRQNAIDRMLVAVHPKHARFYRRLLGFRDFGEERLYGSVRDNPAVACYHDFASLDQERYRLFDHIYGIPFEPWQLLRQPMLALDRQHFEPASTHSVGAMPLPAAA